MEKLNIIPGIVINKQIEVKNYIKTTSGTIPVVPTLLSFKDKIGSMKARLNINRMNYMIPPGLYAVGKAGSSSPVMISANYKLSFDHLRKSLDGINAWILVLDTKGINVWCAAGKGTFGSVELIKRIKSTNLSAIVEHRRIIVPQLGAPGVSAHMVKEGTGFKVVYGPVRSEDIKDFINNNAKATADMRRVKFNFIDRLVLVPVEITLSLKYTLIIISVFIIFSGLNSNGFSLDLLFNNGIKSIVLIVSGVFSGVFLTPALLPYIPGNAFSFKGLVSGISVTGILYYLYPPLSSSHMLEVISWMLIISAISSFLAMNFTGASTYTSLSGVKKEMKYSMPLQIIGFVAGFILWIISRFN